MKISTCFALLCLASAASAQKNPTLFKDANDANYYAPPGGVSFLVVGGSNDCANAATADAITGPGTYAVTNVGATNGLPDGAGCVNTNLDVWFYWTANCTGNVTVATCGGVTADSVLTVWNDGATPGTCPTTTVGCNDDFCGLQSTVTFAAVNGTSYFIQLGAFGAATTYTGTFTVSACVAPPVPPVNDNCATPIVIAGAGTYPFDNRLATTGTEGQTEASCLFFAQTGIVLDSWWTWTPTQSGTVTITTCALLTAGTDTKIAIYNGAGCPVGAAIACVDDSCGLATTVTFAATCGSTYTIQLGGYPYTTPQLIAGSFNIAEAGTPCSTPPVAYCFGDGTGTACPCGNAGLAGNGCASSVNPAGGNLGSSGTASIGADTLTLLGTGMPNASALYFQGTSQISTVFGDGLRCAGGTVIRLGTKTNASGASQYPTLGDLTVSVKGACAAADVRTYQCWYRNAAAFCTPSTFNLTNGLSVTWAP